MYYSINDKYKASQSSKNIFEDVNKDKRNFSADEEKEIKEMEENKNISHFYFKNRHFTIEERPENENDNDNDNVTIKYSNKTCGNFLDLNLVRSNFYNNFSEEENI